MKNLLICLAFLITSFASAQVVYLGGYTSSQIANIDAGSRYPILYNETSNTFQRWNGTTWESWGSGDGGGLSDGVVFNVALTGNNLTFSGANGGFNGIISLAPYLDNTDAQQIGLSGNTLSITNGGSVSLAPYLDNTDTQDLSLASNTLSLVNGGSVSLAPYLDNTDDQTASEVPFTPYSTLASTNVQAAIQELLDENTGTDDQVASEVPITDAGGYYTGVQVEAALQEVGADFVTVNASLANKLESVGVADLNNEDFGDFTVAASVATIDAGVVSEAKLNASVNASLDLADSALQDLADDATPSLSSDLDLSGNSILSSTSVVLVDDDVSVNGNIDITGEYRINGVTLDLSGVAIVPADIGVIDKTLTQSDFGKHNYTDGVLTVTVDNTPSVGSVAIFQPIDIDGVINIVPDTGVSLVGNGTDVYTDGVQVDSLNAISLRKLASNVYSAIGYGKPYSEVTGCSADANEVWGIVNEAGPETDPACNESATIIGSGWTGGGNTFTASADADTSTNPLSTISLLATYADSGGSTGLFTKDVTVVSGATYAISFSAKSSQGSNVRIGVPSGRASGDFGTQQTVTSNNTWVTYSGTITTNSTTLNFLFYTSPDNLGSNGDNLYIDNFSVIRQ